MKNKVTRRQNVKNKVTKSYIRQLVKEALQETTFVDPEGRAVDLASDRLSPRQRVQNKYYDPIRNHPNKEFREKAEKVRLKSLGVPDFDDYDPVFDVVHPAEMSPEEMAEAKKQYQFFVDMSHHQNEKIRSLFLSDNIASVNQALAFAETFPPDKTTPPQLSDDEEFEQGIYDDFDTPGGYGDHNYPSGEPYVPGDRYKEIYDNLMNKAVKRVQDAFDSGEKNQDELALIASKTPGLQQSWDRFGYDLEELNYIPRIAVEKVVGKDNMEDLGYAGRLDESKSSKVTKSYIRRLVKEEIRKGKR